MKFTKRTYTNPGDLLRDISFPIRNGKRLREVREKGIISPAFQERLMMAVTAVNGCRYCSYYHAKEALKTGIETEEIRELLSGGIANCPEDETVALMYAQHWAESDVHPDPEAVERLQQTYGVEKADAIHLVLRLIRMGNLMGNTWDYFLHHLSFGSLTGLRLLHGDDAFNILHNWVNIVDGLFFDDRSKINWPLAPTVLLRHFLFKTVFIQHI